MTASRRRLLGSVAYFVCAGLLAYGEWEWSKFHTQQTWVAPLVRDARPPLARRRPPRPAHVIVVVEENKSPQRIFGNPDASFINALAGRGAVFARAEGLTHPSQPNYLAMFAGVINPDADNCPPAIDPATPSLAGQLRRAGLSFAGFAEDLPSTGFTGCGAGDPQRGYARKHAPWTNFGDVAPGDGRPLRALPPLARMPTVSFVIPNLGHDMHNGSIAEGDSWLRDRLAPLVDRLDAENAWLIVTFDESDQTFPNDVPLIVIGAGIAPGPRDQAVTHYDVLRTIEDAFGLRPLGGAAEARGLSL